MPLLLWLFLFSSSSSSSSSSTLLLLLLLLLLLSLTMHGVWCAISLFVWLPDNLHIASGFICCLIYPNWMTFIILSVSLLNDKCMTVYTVKQVLGSIVHTMKFPNYCYSSFGRDGMMKVIWTWPWLLTVKKWKLKRRRVEWVGIWFHFSRISLKSSRFLPSC